jgi:hypothetical protein
VRCNLQGRDSLTDRRRSSVEEAIDRKEKITEHVEIRTGRQHVAALGLAVRGDETDCKE